MIPKTMRYITHGEGGGPEVMRLADGAVPAIGPGEVLIQVDFAGVNRPDLLQRAGKYPPPPGASPILGLEVAGRVAAVGAEVTLWKVGDQVCALTPGGGYAEFCRTDATHCLALPRGFDLASGAAIPENLLTVWANLVTRGRLQSGENVLIHGGSSGIGYIAIQLAKQFGATVFVTVGNEQKAKFCLSLGVDHVINYRIHDFVAEIKAITGLRGIDIVLDMVGGAYIEKNISLLATEGRLVQIAFIEGSTVAGFDFMPIMLRRLTITGSTLRPRTAEEKASIVRAVRERVWPLLESGQIKIVVDKIFRLSEVAEAHRTMERGAHIGKMVLSLR
ncbi:MAG: NAD(P)H-quinone oxidoreductase [Verrucomicrobia bacterium]|nr:NAD(P)H-quinone oxidoreductase [Verrucomicrobiota bacterium]MBV9641993.1 NAD(P)H-quinone oxidoreductase [Verrucomicrobiota bacterium]